MLCRSRRPRRQPRSSGSSTSSQRDGGARWKFISSAPDFIIFWGFRGSDIFSPVGSGQGDLIRPVRLEHVLIRPERTHEIWITSRPMKFRSLPDPWISIASWPMNWKFRSLPDPWNFDYLLSRVIFNHLLTHEFFDQLLTLPDSIHDRFFVTSGTDPLAGRIMTRENPANSEPVKTSGVISSFADHHRT